MQSIVRQLNGRALLPLLFVLLTLAVGVSRAAEPPAAKGREVPETLSGALVINADDLQQMIASMPNLVLIDTRKAENLKSTINGALHIPEHKTDPSTLLRLIPDKQTPIVFFGESIRDVNNYKAARQVISYGYGTVFWLRGGIAEWMAKGYPLGSFKN